MDFSNILITTALAATGLNAVIFALAAMGLNLHFGYTGLLNFGQAGFLAMAAYGLAITVTYFNLNFFVGIAVGLAGAVVFALLLGAPTLRLRADYLAIVTIAASEIVRLTARSVSLREYTGGSTGLTGFTRGFYDLNPFPAGRYGIGAVDVNEREFYVLVIGWTLIAVISFLLFILTRSPWGRILKGIREDEDAVRSLGKNVYFYKMQSLIIGGVIGSLGGFIFALGTSAVQPDNYFTPLTFFAYTALILGGTGRILGPVVGAMIFWGLIALIEGVLRGLSNTGALSPSIMDPNQISLVRFILVGLGLMALIVFRPQGIFGDKREVALDGR